MPCPYNFRITVSHRLCSLRTRENENRQVGATACCAQSPTRRRLAIPALQVSASAVASAVECSKPDRNGLSGGDFVMRLRPRRYFGVNQLPYKTVSKMSENGAFFAFFGLGPSPASEGRHGIPDLRLPFVLALRPQECGRGSLKGHATKADNCRNQRLAWTPLLGKRP